MAGQARAWAMLLVIALALLVATLATLVAQRLGASVSWPLGIGTGVVVGVFLALSLKRPPEGQFSVDD